MITSLIPMFGPGHHGPPFFLGGPIMLCLFIIALVAGAIFLAKKGKLGPPPWVQHGHGFGPGGPGGHGPGSHGGPCGHHGADQAGHSGVSSAEAKAFSILAERLASGDITPEEYRERVAVLRESVSGQPPTGPSAPPNPNDPHPGDLR